MNRPARMPAAYIAGPYRNRSREGVDLNIQAARAVGLLVCRKGWTVVVPHSNTAHLDLCAPDLGDEFWLAATLELLRRCDAVVLVPGWERSTGTLAEIREADRLHLPIYKTESALPTAADFLAARSEWGDLADGADVLARNLDMFKGGR